jgi:hypothetical protein
VTLEITHETSAEQDEWAHPSRLIMNGTFRFPVHTLMIVGLKQIDLWTSLFKGTLCFNLDFNNI